MSAGTPSGEVAFSNVILRMMPGNWGAGPVVRAPNDWGHGHRCAKSRAESTTADASLRYVDTITCHRYRGRLNVLTLSLASLRTAATASADAKGVPRLTSPAAPVPWSLPGLAAGPGSGLARAGREPASGTVGSDNRWTWLIRLWEGGLPLPDRWSRKLGLVAPAGRDNVAAPGRGTRKAGAGSCASVIPVEEARGVGRDPGAAEATGGWVVTAWACTVDACGLLGDRHLHSTAQLVAAHRMYGMAWLLQ